MDIIGYGGRAVCRLAYEILIGDRLLRGSRVLCGTFDKVVKSRPRVSYGDIHKLRALGQKGRMARGGAAKGR